VGVVVGVGFPDSVAWVGDGAVVGSWPSPAELPAPAPLVPVPVPAPVVPVPAVSVAVASDGVVGASGTPAAGPAGRGAAEDAPPGLTAAAFGCAAARLRVPVVPAAGAVGEATVGVASVPGTVDGAPVAGTGAGVCSGVRGADEADEPPPLTP
jgi:hypothetical protein